MDGISAASAILGVAQIGFQLSQVLVTVIGDYRDAAKNINRLRDEIHLTSIGLQQLGDLANQFILHKSKFGMLEATNLRERCQATFWEIRSAIKKGDIHPNEITKDSIDVTYFTSLKWALYTKNKLAEPRQELDRLKDSLTLCFLSYMALLATNDVERAKYTSQIPGIKRSLDWSQTGPDEDYFEERLRVAGISDEKIAEILGKDPPVVKPSIQLSSPKSPPNEVTILTAWTLDPLERTQEIPLSTEWLERFVSHQDNLGEEDLWQIHSDLHSWFKTELRNLPLDDSYEWSIVHLKPVYKHFWRRGTPQYLEVVMKGVYPEREKSVVPDISTRISTFEQAVPYGMEEQVAEAEISAIPETIAATYDTVEEVLSTETDEEIIARQLALYQ